MNRGAMDPDPATAGSQAGPLAGLRVLDFSSSPAGAQASQTLADFGAEVVHVEPPGGSPVRSMPGYPFIARGKKSIVLDLGADDDLAVARSLARRADIVAALHERKLSGAGQRIDTSLVRGVAAMGTWNWYLQVIASKFPEAYQQVSPVDARGVPLSPMVFMLLIGLTRDGRWLQFSQVQPHLYREMLRVMGLDWMLGDDEWNGAAFASGHPKTEEYWERLLPAVQSRTPAPWQGILGGEPA